ncbi:VOC family protein [Alteromonadaceae bacterium M269]|nr:VOC family protein [Alteromonadaceae bacterium M269]
MNIIDHLSIGVPDIKQATSFYDGLMETLSCKRLATSDGFAAYGKDTVQFLLMLPADGQAYTPGNGTHICFAANTRDSVEAFHAFAVENGGQCEGQPGPRPEYPIPNVYTTFVRDPFGHKLEVIFNGFSTY